FCDGEAYLAAPSPGHVDVDGHDPLLPPTGACDWLPADMALPLSFDELDDQPPPAFEPLRDDGAGDGADAAWRLVICRPEGATRYQAAPKPLLPSPLVCPAALSPAK